MTGVAMALVWSIGIALLITSLARSDRKSAQIINSIADLGRNWMEASLGDR